MASSGRTMAKSAWCGGRPELREISAAMPIVAK
jgi:hypothetical protein